MVQDQPVKESELAEEKIAGCSCLVTFFTQYPNSHISLLNHIHVVSSITNTKHCLFELFFKEFNYLTFLFWSAPAED